MCHSVLMSDENFLNFQYYITVPGLSSVGLMTRFLCEIGGLGFFVFASGVVLESFLQRKTSLNLSDFFAPFPSLKCFFLGFPKNCKFI